MKSVLASKFASVSLFVSKSWQVNRRAADVQQNADNNLGENYTNNESISTNVATLLEEILSLSHIEQKKNDNLKYGKTTINF
ncbi:hypothetical protein T03_18090 [Trichinella britovi]|uniref:Uncharacterized protein n=1 Tax=Trichinella britovi TaxID=45882 RepID=A0A0V1CJ02_TRIBR|nr:hypothetical protein T03_18090 [Trichinella britovi]